jgi:hypothetical protein
LRGNQDVTVGDLFASFDRDAVIEELERQSPRQIANRGGHIEAWNEIVRLKPLPTEYGCRVDLVRREPRPSYIDVSGALEGQEDLLAIEFVDWRQWLSMRVVLGDGMADASPRTVLAAILNEMTFAGYSNMQATGN